jgi:DNA polymerase III delta prime subunit
MNEDESSYIWTQFKQCFRQIIDNSEYYCKLFYFLKQLNSNVLLYGHYGFPTDLFIDELIKEKYNISTLYKQECIWNKDVHYIYNQHFLEIDLLHPLLTNNIQLVSDFIISVIKHKNINFDKHFIIIKHIDILTQNDYNSFRIILERYSSNAFFFCTTHKFDKIDFPVKSRFALMRIPLFTHIEINDIFSKYLHIKMNKHLVSSKSRDIIRAIFIAQIEQSDSQIVTMEFCTLHFPPVYDFIKTFNNKKYSLDAIKQFSYKCFQFNITIPQLMQDLLKILPQKKKYNVIHSASTIDHMLNRTNKGREPIYIETFLCNVLL